MKMNQIVSVMYPANFLPTYDYDINKSEIVYR